MSKNSKPMRVAIIGTRGYPYVYGGYETFVKEMGERLAERGLEVTIYCHAPLFKRKPKRVNGIKLVYIPCVETKSLSQLTNSFLSMVHACFSKADVIFVVNSANGPFGILPKLFGKPSAINVDGLEWLRPKWKGLGARYYRFASRLATKLYDQLITDSDEMQKIYLEEFNAPSKMIAYGANPKVESNGTLIEKWGLEKESFFLIVGRLIPDNNADLIVDGFVKSNSTRKLVIVGDVPYHDRFAQQMKSIPDSRLIFTGYVRDPEELAALYHNCFAYFHGHEYGGTNPAMLKALGYGCAILALDTRFNQEMLQNGKFGWYFDKNSKSVKQIVEASELVPEKMKTLRETSHKGLVQKYDWDFVTDEYETLFKKLCKRRIEDKKLVEMEAVG
jgi:glycosyltransferase involved in cell wall biosynthesis